MSDEVRNAQPETSPTAITSCLIPVLSIAREKVKRIREKFREQDARVPDSDLEFMGGIITGQILVMDAQMFPPTIVLAGAQQMPRPTEEGTVPGRPPGPAIVLGRG